MYRIIKWSFENLATGRWPLADHLGNKFPQRSFRARLAGQPLLAPGWVGLFTEMRGDWKFLKETFHLNHYGNAGCMCHLSGARRDDNSYAETGPLASWRGTEVSNETFLRSFAQDQIPTFCRLPGFWLQRIFIDSMHCVDMGVAPHIIGNVIWEIIALGSAACVDTSRARRLDLGYEMYRQFCKFWGIGVTSAPWNPEKLNKKSAKQPAFMKAKANEGKKVVPFALHLCNVYGTESPHDQMRKTTVWAHATSAGRS